MGAQDEMVYVTVAYTVPVVEGRDGVELTVGIAAEVKAAIGQYVV